MGLSIARLLRQSPGSNGLYTSADLLAVVNDANLDVVKDTNALQDMGEVYSVDGTYQYALSALCPNALSIWKVYWNNIPLTKVNFGNFHWSTSNPKTEGDPRIYRIWKNMLELDSTPQSSYPIDAYFTYKPTVITSLSTVLTPELPSEYHMAIVYRACSYLAVRDEKETRAGSFFGRYQYELSRLRALAFGQDSQIIDLDPSNAASLNNWGSY